MLQLKSSFGVLRLRSLFWVFLYWRINEKQWFWWTGECAGPFYLKNKEGQKNSVCLNCLRRCDTMQITQHYIEHRWATRGRQTFFRRGSVHFKAAVCLKLLLPACAKNQLNSVHRLIGVSTVWKVAAARAEMVLREWKWLIGMGTHTIWKLKAAVEAGFMLFDMSSINHPFGYLL